MRLTGALRALRAETALAAVTADAMTYAYRVNAIGAPNGAARASQRRGVAERPGRSAGPTLVLKAFSPLLRRTAAANATRRGNTVAPTVAANLSARVSSIRENRLGGWHSYRASNTALNMLTKSAAVELGQGSAPVICLLLHPGTVATDLSRPFNRNGAPRSVRARAPRRALTPRGPGRSAGQDAVHGGDGGALPAARHRKGGAGRLGQAAVLGRHHGGLVSGRGRGRRHM